MKRIAMSLVAAALVAAAGFAQANEEDRPDARALPLGDARAYGLQGALTAVNDDMNTLFFNPAGLAFLRRNYLNANLGTSLTFTNGYTDYIPYTDSYLQPNLVVGGKGWGLALIEDCSYYVKNAHVADMEANAELPIYVSRRVGAAGGLGLNLGPLALGANLKCYSYSDYSLSYEAASSDAEFYSLLATVPFRNAADAVTTWEMNVGLGALVTLGAFNVGAYYDNMMPFINAIVNDQDYSIDAYLLDCFKTMSLGLSFMPSNDKFSAHKLPVDFLASLDLKNLGDDEERLLCAGAEFGFDLWNVLVATARLGYKQALPTETFSLDALADAFSPQNAEISVGATAKLAMAKADITFIMPVDTLSSMVQGLEDGSDYSVKITAALCF